MLSTKTIKALLKYDDSLTPVWTEKCFVCSAEFPRRGGKVYCDDCVGLVRKAQSLCNTAIKNGTLVRQSCEVCGKKKGQAHHDDYTKPLDVRWLCPKHHAQADKERRLREK